LLSWGQNCRARRFGRPPEAPPGLLALLPGDEERVRDAGDIAAGVAALNGERLQFLKVRTRRLPLRVFLSRAV
jgi:hypothetical protein